MNNPKHFKVGDSVSFIDVNGRVLFDDVYYVDDSVIEGKTYDLTHAKQLKKVENN